MFERFRSGRSQGQGERALKALVSSCERLIGEAGESVGLGIARQILQSYDTLGPDFKSRFFKALADGFNPDPGLVEQSAKRYAQSQDPKDLIQMVADAQPPRQELFRRLNRVPEGCAALVKMRESLLQSLAKDRSLKAVDSDLEHLLASWFNPGFLRLEQISWESSAGLLEQIIRHEAVHEIDGWADLRRRLEPDRRLFAFFHPALPKEPLIFVEVALLYEMPDAIAPLLDRKSCPEPSGKPYKVAAFYSISNCQPGLKGVHLGNFLIKQVAEALKLEFPDIRQFCTLSPIPEFVRWLLSNEPFVRDSLTEKVWLRLEDRRRQLLARVQSLSAASDFARLAQDEGLRSTLGSLGAAFLGQVSSLPHQADPVARFHLHNGARLDRINHQADLSVKGLKQSLGLMVNYLYDLPAIEENHDAFLRGEIVRSKSVADLISR
ncbi:MAG: malonyl-CoA decarboxylase family protein [Bordetella sp.]